MRIALWGNFGARNLGNECTLYAMLSAGRRYVPDSDILAICSDPLDAAVRHDIAALPIASTSSGVPLSRWRPLHLLRRLAIELRDWVQAIGAMRTIDMLVMTGTGMLTDKNEALLGMPYQMLKWASAARLRGKPVLFVSVGVEQLIDPLKVRFMGWALHLACYRSYRDDASRRRARRLLSLSSADPLYPDLAFSLPESLFSECQQSPASEPTVAVGIYAVELGPNEVRDYVERIGTFLLRLLECGRRVRVVIGDVYYDEVARQQLRAWLEERNVYDRIVDEAATSFQELIRQLAEADFVVATRFHNLVLALLVGKPVVSISHMEKNDELMAAMGLPEYSLPLRDAQPEQLLQRLAWMECRAGELRRLIGERIQEYRARLEEQYATVFTRLTDRGGERRLR